MLSDVKLSDLRLAYALLVGPYRVGLWSRFKRTHAPEWCDRVRARWRGCVVEAVSMRRDAEARRRLRALGEHFGYPSCCVDDFCRRAEDLQNARRGGLLPWAVRELVGRATPSVVQLAASCGTGFVPCHEHAMRLMDHPPGPERVAALAALVTGRAHPRPFPDGRRRDVAEEAAR